MDDKTFDKLKGLFWGLVVGDCLGSPIQFSPKDDHPRITEMVHCPVFGTPAGYWTDDSSMAFCVADSFVRSGGYDRGDIAVTFSRWYRDGYWSSLPHAFDVGSATAHACSAIRIDGSLVNGDEASQGNGSIMRLAPSYLIARHAGHPEALHEVSDITHASSRVREVVDDMAAVLDEHVAGRRTSRRSAFKTRGEVDNSGWAVTTLEAALWAFGATDSFEEALVAAVNLGGDADTIGAVCGQIAGAFYGFSAIPGRWLEAVKDRREINGLIEKTLAMCG